MEFLKSILGEELYKQVADAISTHNGKPENKDKQVKACRPWFRSVCRQRQV